MASILLTPPAVEPISLAEAKLYLRVEHDDDDELIGSLITGARTIVEQSTYQALIVQTRRFVYDRWPRGGRLALAHAPVRSVLAARYYDAGNAPHAIDVGAFVVNAAAAVLGFVPSALPAPGREVAGIELDVELGYGPAGIDVPEPLREAVRQLVVHFYEHRGMDADKRLLDSQMALIAPYRMLSL